MINKLLTLACLSISSGPEQQGGVVGEVPALAPSAAVSAEGNNCQQEVKPIDVRMEEVGSIAEMLPEIYKVLESDKTKQEEFAASKKQLEIIQQFIRQRGDIKFFMDIDDCITTNTKNKDMYFSWPAMGKYAQIQASKKDAVNKNFFQLMQNEVYSRVHVKRKGVMLDSFFKDTSKKEFTKGFNDYLFSHLTQKDNPLELVEEGWKSFLSAVEPYMLYISAAHTEFIETRKKFFEDNGLPVYGLLGKMGEDSELYDSSKEYVGRRLQNIVHVGGHDYSQKNKIKSVLLTHSIGCKTVIFVDDEERHLKAIMEESVKQELNEAGVEKVLLVKHTKVSKDAKKHLDAFAGMSDDDFVKNFESIYKRHVKKIVKDYHKTLTAHNLSVNNQTINNNLTIVLADAEAAVTFKKYWDAHPNQAAQSLLKDGGYDTSSSSNSGFSSSSSASESETENVGLQAKKQPINHSQDSIGSSENEDDVNTNTETQSVNSGSSQPKSQGLNPEQAEHVSNRSVDDNITNEHDSVNNSTIHSPQANAIECNNEQQPDLLLSK